MVKRLWGSPKCALQKNATRAFTALANIYLWLHQSMAQVLLPPTNGMDAPTRNGIDVPKWER